MSEIITHKGIITDINEQNIVVKIESASACSGCHAKGACGMADKKEKIIETTDSQPQNYHVGETVEVLISSNTGFKALFLGYMIPFLVLVISLFVSYQVLKNELWAGLICIGLVGVYYIILYFFKNKISNQFTILIRKLVE